MSPGRRINLRLLYCQQNSSYLLPHDGSMMFEWDQDKAKSNLRKHSVSFEEAITALLDPLSRTALDPDHSVNEYRFVTFGISARQRLLVVSYTERGNCIRIVSARLATKRERQIYEEY